MSAVIVSIAGSLVLAGFHALTPVLDVVPARYRDSLASLSGGAGLAYVFLYLLFELATEGAPKLHALMPLGPAALETVFVLLLAAVTAWYLVQMRLEKTSNVLDDHHGFALLFILYNFVAGAGVLEEASWGALNLALYNLAIGLHLLFNDWFLLHLCPSGHTWRWRSALAAAPVLGCSLAAGLPVPAGLRYAALALVAGGTIINVLRRELPDVRRFRPLWFAAGVIGYALLILATWRF